MLKLTPVWLVTAQIRWGYSFNIQHSTCQSSSQITNFPLSLGAFKRGEGGSYWLGEAQIHWEWRELEFAGRQVERSNQNWQRKWSGPIFCESLAIIDYLVLNFCFSFAQPLEQPEPVHLIISKSWDQYARYWAGHKQEGMIVNSLPRKSKCGFMLMLHTLGQHSSAQSSENGWKGLNLQTP